MFGLDSHLHTLSEHFLLLHCYGVSNWTLPSLSKSLSLLTLTEFLPLYSKDSLYIGEREEIIYLSKR